MEYIINNKEIIGIIGFGIVGKAVQHGFQQMCDFRIHDKNPKLSQNTLKKVCEDSDYIFICVPTPVDLDTGEQDISIVEKVVDDCSKYVAYTDKILIIKSTLVPGTTDRLTQKHFDCNIVFNPEFLTERSYRLDFINTSRIILGGGLHSTTKVKELYEKRFGDSVKIYLTDETTAEMVKCLANCFLATKVMLCNEFYDICKSMDLSYVDVMDMILADGRIGRSHTQVPGHDGKRGVGQKCFPKDMTATIKFAEQCGVDPIIMKAAWQKNLLVRPERDWEKIKGAVSNNNNKKRRKK